MSDGKDAARQAANVAGAIFQTFAGLFFVANLSAEPVADEQGSTLIDPAGYAFFIWAPILLLCLAYAAYQALPSRRESPLLRRVGWFSAGAFLLNGSWEIVSPLGWLSLSQALIAGILLCAGGAYLGVVRSEPGSSHRLDRWLVAPTLGLLFGWVTAANAVSLTSQAARSVLVDGAGAGEALLGSTLLVLGTVLAVATIMVGRNGPRQGQFAYSGAFLWALVGIVANQYEASIATTAVASLCAALVALVLFDVLRAGRSRLKPRHADAARVRPGPGRRAP